MSITPSIAVHHAISGRAVSVAAVYLSALLQGMTLVSFPALSTVLKDLHGFSDAQYGAIFLPQVAAAIIGAVVGGALAKKIGLKALLLLALAANFLSQIALAGSNAVSSEIAYAVVLLGTGSLGLGFGLAGAPLNSFPPLLFPRQSNSAVVAVHTAMGLGLTLGPLAVAALMKTWLLFPMSLAVACILLMLIAAFVREPVAPSPQPSPAGKGGGDTAARSLAFWLFAAVAVLYAFAEGTFSN
ncbi:MAG: MFS transporter, partial [Burkholderiales bacterium]